MTVGTELHACIEIESHAVFLMVNMVSGMDHITVPHSEVICDQLLNKHTLLSCNLFAKQRDLCQ